MRAILIDAEQQTSEVIDIQGHDDIVRLVGFDTIESDSVGSEGDKLYFDEECFLRQAKGRFQIDSLIPVAGKGVIVGGGDGQELTDAVIDVDELKARIKYL